MLPDPPRAAQRFQQGRSDRVRAGAAQARRADALDRRHRNAAGTQRRAGHAGLGHTGFPEIMDGRVKTLHPKIHGGLLGRRDVDDAVMRQHGIEPIDLLVVNLYPFAATIAKPDCTYEDAIENIDIGGPAMVRAAAKNHDRVAVIVDPLDYAARARRARRAATARYRERDAQASRRQGVRAHGAATTPRSRAISARVNESARVSSRNRWRLSFRKRMDLRYGENPHQTAAFYRRRRCAGRQHRHARSSCRARTLSYNNIADGDTAFECVRQFDEPACVIVKHANPCGVAVASDTLAAYDRAYDRSDVRVRRHHRVQSCARRRYRARDRRAAVRRVDHRAGRSMPMRSRSARAKKTCACS